jgi:hypothetical protein
MVRACRLVLDGRPFPSLSASSPPTLLALHPPPPLVHAGILIIPTCQHSDLDLVRVGEAVEDEKDRLLERVRLSLPPPPCLAPDHSHASPKFCVLSSMYFSLRKYTPFFSTLQFLLWAQSVCTALSAAGHWADYIDPCSGLPMIHRETGSVYGEVQALATLLGYRLQNAGCCKIVLHPRWGSAVYPASVFARAPVEAVMGAVAVAELELHGRG